MDGGEATASSTWTSESPLRLRTGEDLYLAVQAVDDELQTVGTAPGDTAMAFSSPSSRMREGAVEVCSQYGFDQESRFLVFGNGEYCFLPSSHRTSIPFPAAQPRGGL